MASNLTQALRRVGGLTIQRLRQGLVENNSDASGELGKSIGANIKETPKGIDMNIIMLDYYVEVDEGQKPGTKVEADKIAEWLTYPNVRDKMGNRGFNITENSINPLAKNIANRLTIDGRDGNDFATNVFESRLIKQELPDLVADAVFEDANMVINELIANIE